jgi:hypothetical protein
MRGRREDENPDRTAPRFSHSPRTAWPRPFGLARVLRRPADPDDGGSEATLQVFELLSQFDFGDFEGYRCRFF